MLSFHVVTLWLNSVGSSSINKVFRRSAVCSPFPSLSEWLSVSVCSARSKCCLGVETPLEFLGERCQKFIQDYFKDKSTRTEMHHSCFLKGVVWVRAGVNTVENWLWQFSLTWHRWHFCEMSAVSGVSAYMKTMLLYKLKQALTESAFSCTVLFGQCQDSKPIGFLA